MRDRSGKQNELFDLICKQLEESAARGPRAAEVQGTKANGGSGKAARGRVGNRRRGSLAKQCEPGAFR